MTAAVSQRFVLEERLFSFLVDMFAFPFRIPKSALTVCEYLFNIRSLNSDLRRFRGVLDDVGTKTTPA